MRWFLNLLWRDWSRAPISGTVIIVLLICAAGSLNALNVDRALLFFILAGIYSLQRGPMDEE